MLIYMVPTLTATFAGVGMKLPITTRLIILMSDFLIGHTLLLISTLVLLLLLSYGFYKSKTGGIFKDRLILHLPVIGSITKEVQSARTARSLASLLAAGVEIVVALDVTMDIVQNHLYKGALLEARGAIEKGTPLSEIFNKYENLYPVFVAEMISVGEETGKISEMLIGVADYYENEVDQSTKDLSTIIEPLLMIFIGVGVGIFAISMLAPTYSLVNNF